MMCSWAFADIFVGEGNPLLSPPPPQKKEHKVKTGLQYREIGPYKEKKIAKGTYLAQLNFN